MLLTIKQTPEGQLVERMVDDMMYTEFIEGTGCRENDHNYKVYKDLEVMYMNSDLTKEEIYEYGKKLVDNSKSEQELEIENQWKCEIASLKEQLKGFREEVKRYQEYYDTDRTDKFWRDQRDFSKECVRKCRVKIKELQWILGM